RRFARWLRGWSFGIIPPLGLTGVCLMGRIASCFAIVVVLVGTSAYAQPQSPEEFLGHPVGADYTLVKWPRIVEYFEHLAANSDRVNLRTLGQTTEGKPFLLAEISDAATI